MYTNLGGGGGGLFHLLHHLVIRPKQTNQDTSFFVFLFFVFLVGGRSLCGGGSLLHLRHHIVI
jgi:hypothetical protein